MKIIISAVAILMVLFSSVQVKAQWPGCFYAFGLKGANGETVDSSNQSYRLLLDAHTVGPASVEICEDNKTWEVYKGDKNLFGSNFLIIERLSGPDILDSMLIEFPPTLSKGKESYYMNLYAGEIKYKKGSYEIILPKTGKQWDRLKEIAICPKSYMTLVFYDTSSYQK